jgi:hypothetical protein
MLKNAAFFLLASALAIVMVPYVFAAEVGNLYQSDEGEGKFKLELKYDHQTREVELDSDFVVCDFKGVAPTVYRVSLKVKDFDGEEVSDRYYLKASLTATPRVEVYAKLGTGRLKSKFFDPYSSKTLEIYDVNGVLTYRGIEAYLDSQISGKGDYGFLGGVGVKAIVHQSGTFQVGLDLQYVYQESDDVLFLSKWSEDVYDPGVDRYREEVTAEVDESETQELHLALIASKKMGNFTPYGGVKVSWYETEYDGKASYSEKYEDFVTPANSWSEAHTGDFDFETEQQDYVGFFVGADYSFTENFGVNAEVRLGDEEGFATGLCWKF